MFTRSASRAEKQEKPGIHPLVEMNGCAEFVKNLGLNVRIAPIRTGFRLATE